MQIMYVETCPDCECVVVRAPSGETKPSRLMAGCTGCSCHKSWQAELRQAEVRHVEVRQVEVRQVEVRQAEVRQAELARAEVPQQGQAEKPEQLTRIAASGS